MLEQSFYHGHVVLLKRLPLGDISFRVDADCVGGTLPKTCRAAKRDEEIVWYRLWLDRNDRGRRPQNHRHAAGDQESRPLGSSQNQSSRHDHDRDHAYCATGTTRLQARRREKPDASMARCTMRGHVFRSE
jgi:hypothetical protein